MNLLNRLRPDKTGRANAPAETGPDTQTAAASGSAGAPAASGGGAEAGASASPLPETGPVAELLATIDTLEEVLARETALLSENDPDAMAEVQERKAQLAAAYETRVKDLTSDPTPLQELDEAARTALRERMTTFDRTMRANARAINAARAVTEDLLRSTVEIVKDHRRENGGYAPNGTRREETARLREPLNIDRNL